MSKEEEILVFGRRYIVIRLLCVGSPHNWMSILPCWLLLTTMFAIKNIWTWIGWHRISSKAKLPLWDHSLAQPVCGCRYGSTIRSNGSNNSYMFPVTTYIRQKWKHKNQKVWDKFHIPLNANEQWNELCFVDATNVWFYFEIVI